MPLKAKESSIHYLMRVAEIFRSKIVIKVRNFSADPTARFYAEIEHIEVVIPGGFQSPCGNGRTPYEAMQNYRECIEGKVIVKFPNLADEIRATVESGE